MHLRRERTLSHVALKIVAQLCKSSHYGNVRISMERPSVYNRRRPFVGAAFPFSIHLQTNSAGSVYPTILSRHAALTGLRLCKMKNERACGLLLFFTSRYLSSCMLSGRAKPRRENLLCDLTRTSNRNDRTPDVNNRRNSLELRRASR